MTSTAESYSLPGAWAFVHEAPPSNVSGGLKVQQPRAGLPFQARGRVETSASPQEFQPTRWVGRSVETHSMRPRQEIPAAGVEGASIRMAQRLLTLVELDVPLRELRIRFKTRALHEAAVFSTTRQGWEPPKVDVEVVAQAVPTRKFFADFRRRGRVTAIHDETFEAIIEQGEDDGRDQLAVFPRDLVVRADADLLVVGAGFVWAMGYEERQDGTRPYCSWLQFDCLPPRVTEHDLAEAREKAERVASVLGLELDWAKE